MRLLKHDAIALNETYHWLSESPAVMSGDLFKRVPALWIWNETKGESIKNQQSQISRELSYSTNWHIMI